MVQAAYGAMLHEGEWAHGLMHEVSYLRRRDLRTNHATVRQITIAAMNHTQEGMVISTSEEVAARNMLGITLVTTHTRVRWVSD
jgi:hypothetical protein